MLCRTFDLNRFLVMAYAVENGHEIWNFKSRKARDLVPLKQVQNN